MEQTVEAGQVNVVHVSSFSGKVVFSKTKAKYGDASRVITWRILYSCFGLGFTTASIKTLIAGCATPISARAFARRSSAAHSNMGDKIGNVPLFYSVWEGGANNLARDVRCNMVTLDMYGSMSAYDWRAWVQSLRKKANKFGEKDDRILSQMLVLYVARRLKRKKRTMTAQTLVALLNEVDQFRCGNWHYSESCRGPCSSVRGIYNAYVNAGRNNDAATVAAAFTTVRGAYAYEK